jgi:hypothetical protein
MLDITEMLSILYQFVDFVLMLEANEICSEDEPTPKRSKKAAVVDVHDEEEQKIV